MEWPNQPSDSIQWESVEGDESLCCPATKTTDISHLLKLDRLYNWWVQNTFFANYIYRPCTAGPEWWIQTTFLLSYFRFVSGSNMTFLCLHMEPWIVIVHLCMSCMLLVDSLGPLVKVDRIILVPDVKWQGGKLLNVWHWDGGMRFHIVHELKRFLTF